MDTAVWAFALLVAALLVFIVSTRQWPLGQRTLIWGAGAALLAVSYVLTSKLGPQDGFVQSALDALGHGRDSLFGEVVEGNRRIVNGYIGPMLDVLLVFGAIAALLALIAFTPGEAIERITRPLCIAALGAVGGGIVALTVVAFGFGGYPERRVFFGVLHETDVIDGDTIRLGDLAMRLGGIDAPEFTQLNVDGTMSADDQICYLGAVAKRCGDEARNVLVQLVQNQVVVCKKASRTRDLYGRPIVICTARISEENWPGLAQEVARAGYATALETGGTADQTYQKEIDDAKQNGRGIWAYCLLKPAVWRNNSGAKKRFVESGGTDWDEGDVVSAANCAHKKKS